MLTSSFSVRALQHDIRTPLTTIFGMVFYLKKTFLTRMQAEYVDTILASANDLLKVANRLRNQMPQHKFNSLKKPKVLLVEDNPLIQRVHQDMLWELGCETDVVKDAAEALVIGSHVYDLILLDIGLPDLNGFEVAKKLRQYPNHNHTPIFALTAYVDPATERQCLEAGIARILYKPVELNTLAEVLRDYNLIGEKPV